MKKIVALLALPILVAMILGGCSGQATAPSASSSTYRVDAILVKNTQTGAAQIDLVLKKNGAYYTAATITLAGIPLDKDIISYYKVFSSSQILAGSGYTLSIQDSPNFSFSGNITVPRAFTMWVTQPSNREYHGANPVSVDWSNSIGAAGYILATVPPSRWTPSHGYKAYCPDRPGQILPEGFKDSDTFMVGINYIYVGAYWGAPISSPSIPFEIPTVSNPADNISGTLITGRVASIVIPAYDSVIVSLL